MVFDQPYQSITSKQAYQALDRHYGDTMNLYKIVAHPITAIKALLYGWERAPEHPAMIHLGWDADKLSLNECLKQSVREIVTYLQLDPLQNPLILDAGCGVGGASLLIGQEYAGIETMGLSLIPKQIDQAQRLQNARQITTTHFQVANLLHVPFKDATFDGIFSLEALCHVPEAEKLDLFTEFYRILKPKQRFVCMDMYFSEVPDENLLADYNHLKQGFTLPDQISPQRLRELAEQAGLCCHQEIDVTDQVRPFVKLLDNLLIWFYNPIIKSGTFFSKVPQINRLIGSLGLNYHNVVPVLNAWQGGVNLSKADVIVYYVHVFTKP
ncbi:MAG: class I SAM-dependent methyltransferase [Chloroflexota bacterium]